jgi:hypothetical protein
MKEFLLKDVVHARSGDKGDVSNICVFARDPRHYPALKKILSAEINTPIWNAPALRWSGTTKER